MNHNRYVPYINTQTWGLQTTARQNKRLLSAIEEQRWKQEAKIELLAWLVVLGIVLTVILLAWWMGPVGKP